MGSQDSAISVSGSHNDTVCDGTNQIGDGTLITLNSSPLHVIFEFKFDHEHLLYLALSLTIWMLISESLNTIV